MKTLTTVQVADILQLDPETVRRFINEGKIKGFKAGKEWRVLEEDLLKYIDDNRKTKEVNDEC